MRYRRELDGLRAIAVLPVIFFHAGFHILSGGFVGVDIFFVISGYLITSNILTEKQAGTFSLIEFYERRARRILPALFFVMLACLPFAWLWMLPSDLKSFSQSLIAISVFSSNILFWQESGYFDIAAELKPLLHIWSLGVEEQYYLLFPVFIMCTYRLNKRLVIGIFIGVALTSLALAHWGSFNKPVATFYLLPTRAWEMLIGALVAFYLRSKYDGLSVIYNKLASQFASIFGLLLIGYAVFAFDKSTPFPSLYSLIPTVGAALIILFATPQTIVGRLLASKLLVGVGLISYSAYLWHQPVFAFARLGHFDVDNIYVLVLIISSVFVFSYFSWKYIEKPIRYRLFLRSRMRFLLTTVLLTLLFISVGLLGHLTDGFKGKFDKDKLHRLAMVEALDNERGKTIRVGICHFNASINLSGIHEFLNQWNCFADAAQPSLKKIPLIITGDSHSADKVAALKLNGYVPLQIGGAGCSLNPKMMTKECKLIFEKLYQITINDKYYQYIAIANNIESEEGASLDSMRETIDYWKKFNKKIIFFTAMPIFPMYKENIANLLPLKANFKFAKLSERTMIADYLASQGVHVINTREIFCATRPDCDFKDEKGALLLTDQTHLSKTGAMLFGKQLIKQDALIRLIIDNR